MDIISILLGICIVFLIHFYTHRVRNGAPGPFPLPIIGNLHLLDKGKPYIALNKLYKQYGKIFSFYMGSVYTIVLNEPDIIQEALIDNNDVFTDRFITQLIFIIGGGKDVGFSNGEYWKKVRSIWSNAFTRSKVLKIEDTIKTQINQCLLALEKESEIKKPIDLKWYVKKLAFGIQFKLLLSKDTSYKSSTSELDKMIDATDKIQRYFAQGDIGDFIPFLKIFSNYQGMESAINDIEKNIKKYIKESKQTIDRENPKNFLESFIVEVEKDTSNLLDEDSIVKNCNDFLIAGTDTVGITIDWSLIFLANYPDIQEKIYYEISHFVGNVDDYQFSNLRNSLPFTNNFLKEVWRMRPVVPLSLPHKTNRDITLNNYFIPKDTLVIPNLYSASHSEKYWKDPHIFDPNRHINSENSAMVFSCGGRKCVGMNIAEVIVLLTIVMILKKFKIERISDDLISEETNPGLTLDSLRYQANLTLRN